ncbi:hypothetical protein [Clostridium akagii]|uniref:hypothetical protein n=1 Tax=Clostridium akagii TaxID=91623 RepID=UPI00047AB2B4|nr:hypothetical protein [Clostridium akagii]
MKDKTTKQKITIAVQRFLEKTGGVKHDLVLLANVIDRLPGSSNLGSQAYEELIENNYLVDLFDLIDKREVAEDENDAEKAEKYDKEIKSIELNHGITKDDSKQLISALSKEIGKTISNKKE